MTDATPEGGTYTLVVSLLDEVTVEVGALGTIEFQPGWYAYTGSALGQGGFSRVERHRELARGASDTRHWHVDYLLGLEAAGVDDVFRSPGLDAECPVARAIEGVPVAGFGATDCRCDTHLTFSPQRDALVEAVEAAHARARTGDAADDVATGES
ncbi:GIY-YIG nuclease family protein [Halobacteriales archaeon Cl-PHB]